MINYPPTLNDYVMPHDLDRTGQEEAFEAVLEWYMGDKQYMGLSAPTGIGKTGIIAQMVKYARILMLARTKSLPKSVYKAFYDFEVLEGKRNYACRVSPLTHQADVCAVTDRKEKYEACEGSRECQYYVDYEHFCDSPKASTTYAKYTSDRKSYNCPSLFVFDEAHEVPEIVIEQSGTNLNVNTHHFLKGFGKLQDNEDMGFEEGISIMRKLYGVALGNVPELKKPADRCSDDEVIQFRRRLIRHRRFLERLKDSAKLMIKSDDEGINIWHYSSTKNGDFSARPMTAAYHFKNILDTGHHKTLLMTATMTPFIAEMLGIEEEDFYYYEAPQQFPPTMRPIFDLGQPGMGYGATNDNPGLWNIQAVKISNVLKTRPLVSSVILTTSKKKAAIIASNLKRLGHDVFQPPQGLGTDLQLRSWENYRKPGAVCVSYNFWEGVSLDLDHMLFIAGVKYPDLSSAFEKARANRSWTEFNYRAAINIVQGSGRIQRGHVSDYLPIGSKQVFIADGNYTRVLSFAPGDFADRIVPW